MPLVLDPHSLPRKTRRELRTSLLTDLLETRRLIERPGGEVFDPASLETASELLGSTLVRLELPGRKTEAALGADVNLAYAMLLAVIDLVKSHTEVPHVPRRRASP